MRFTFRAKLLASHLGLVAAVVLIVILELNRSLGADLRKQLDDRLEQQAKGAAMWVGEGRRHPEKLSGRLAQVVNADVTILDPQGNVLGESEGAGPGASQADYPEVAAALRGEVGHASRVVGADELHFVAVPAGDGLVVRLGAPVSHIDATLGAMRRRLLFALALAIFAAASLGFLASRIASRPLREMTEAATRIGRGDYDIGPASASPDEFGILSRSLVVLADELKARIGDLTAERDRLSAIFAGMDEGVVVLDGESRVLSANPAALRILSLQESPDGKALADVAVDDDVRAFIEQTVTAGAAHEKQIETQKAGRFLEIYARPLAVGGAIAVLRDMTRVNRLLSMRRDFVANVSHELRTPVAAIQGYAETLLRGSADPPTAKQFLEILHRQAKRLGVLVQQLLELSDLEARPSESAPRAPFDLAAIAQHVVETVKGRAAGEGASLSLDVAGAPAAVGDAAGMEQVIENLVDNALKYGRRGGTVSIRARGTAGEKGDPRVELAVVDDGEGIEARHLPHLFERFYRVDPGRSRDRGGTGLGLAIVKHLVEAMGGKVRVESQVGKGSSFIVDLPRAQPAR